MSKPITVDGTTSQSTEPGANVGQNYVDQFGATLDLEINPGEWRVDVFTGSYSITFRCTGDDGITKEKKFFIRSNGGGIVPRGVYDTPNNFSMKEQ
jgi:hypothetical protein